jgi:hypothetical protein
MNVGSGNMFGHKQTKPAQMKLMDMISVTTSILTFIRRSRKARRPASVQIALMSAPENSSLVITNSSRFTSSDMVILEVWICIDKEPDQ